MLDWRFKIQICAPFIFIVGMCIPLILDPYGDLFWTRPAMFILMAAVLISVLNLLNMILCYSTYRRCPK